MTGGGACGTARGLHDHTSAAVALLTALPDATTSRTPSLSLPLPHHPTPPGMTLGIMGLDKVGLEIVAKAGDTEKERKHARE